MSAPPQYKYLFKIALVGDCKVGKTTLLFRFIKGTFSVGYQPTIGIDFGSKYVEMDGTSIRVQIWDTSGQDRFRPITTAYFPGSGGIILVYDVANHSSYVNVARWLKDLRYHIKPGTPILLIGNKSDLCLGREVTTEEAQHFAAAEGLSFIEISALDGYNVESALRAILNDIYRVISGKHFQAPYLIQSPRGKAIDVTVISGANATGSRRCY
ncbi:hypothetical protein M408DRAFT_328274 [Serendipita vermifera MAFF 305830]|uniref:Uncharacterized protein n=1 Tax=Serendipita vermifera MAFF 305830 TaxID=933852 RepID=A0A0C3BDK5_SERVB|nr:hypothetical protein M408DRAFT_328274 [Serendipita vermifera MAFF 305830]